ncbi:MAG: Lipoprotein [Chloroflexi bacterium CSP1-4]|nr:MAG: Lipoprotein [Chloroflexi bacterium CSP1-4]
MAVAYLDVEDEITTAVTRIRASEEPHLALVLPPGSRIGTSRINFRLLAREARESQRSIAIVTVEPGVRAIAVSAGLAAYASVGEYEAAGAVDAGAEPGRPTVVTPPAPESESRAPVEPEPAPLVEPQPAPPTATPRPEPAFDLPLAGGLRRETAPAPGRRRGFVIALVALLAVALVLAAVGALLVLPSATITVVPRIEDVGPIALTIVADPQATEPDLVTGVVPAQTVEFSLRASRVFDVTGVKVSETKATGTVVFTNLDTGGRNTIPAGSIVATDSNVRFATLAAVTLPRAKIIGGTRIVPGRATVRVEAVAAGESGNVAANAIDNVPSGEDPIVLQVSNPDATTGGTRTETKQVSQDDLDQALAALSTDLDSQLAAALAEPATAPAGTTLVQDTAAMGDPAPEPAPKSLLGQEVETFELTLSATATVLAIDESGLEPLAREALTAELPTGREVLPDTVQVTIGEPRVEEGRVTIAVSVTARAWQPLDAAALLARVRGLSVAEAYAALESYGEVTIETSPFYVGTIPTLDDRTTLTISSPASPSP